MYNDRETVQRQYADAANLRARSAIYRFAEPATTPWPRWVFDQLGLPPDARVLEVGSGDGGLWKRNLDRLPAAWRVVMLDLSHGMLTAARGDLPAAQFAFAQGDAARLPLADAQFDAVVANHMLYHVADRAAALREIRRVLVPRGGRLFATTNSDEHLGPMRRLINEFLGDGSPLREPLPFSLENGAAALGAVFPRVERRENRGALRVTDADAVIRYVMSVTGAPERITGARLDELRRRAAREIETHGAFVFPTAAGMFVAGE
jgi:ubiquinone/menaquinone biosynthesis C-methylase UbiE